MEKNMQNEIENQRDKNVLLTPPRDTSRKKKEVTPMYDRQKKDRREFNAEQKQKDLDKAKKRATKRLDFSGC